MRRSDTEKESTGIAMPATSDTFQDWQYLGAQNRKIKLVVYLKNYAFGD